MIPKDWKISLQLPEGSKKVDTQKTLKKFKTDLDKTLVTMKSKPKLNSYFSSFDKSLSYHQIKDGIHLIHKLNSKVKTFSFHTYLKGGLSEEDKKNNGTYHF